jgi:hypothetical protein
MTLPPTDLKTITERLGRSPKPVEEGCFLMAVWNFIQIHSDGWTSDALGKLSEIADERD